MENLEKSPKELKKFGLTMALICFLFSLVGIWKNSALTGLALGLWGATGVFLVLALVAPTSLRLFEKFWMALAEKINKVVTPIILTITFYVLITPLGLLLKLMGKDILSLKIDKTRTTYWEEVDQAGSASRYYTPY